MLENMEVCIMYERSAIVLERYFEKKFGFDQKSNLKINYGTYRDMVEEWQKYQAIVEEEETIIKQFDTAAKEIQTIQKKQEKLVKENENLEEQRNRLFNNLEEEPTELEKQLEKVELKIEKNNEQLKELRNEFIENYSHFSEKQKERNKCARTRRLAEGNHLEMIKLATEQVKNTSVEEIKKIKQYVTLEAQEKELVEQELIKIMLDNGKSEKVKFHQEVIQRAVKVRMEIAKEEAESYVLVFDKLRRLLNEIENDNVKITKYQKTLRDISVKFAFLQAEKEYLVSFLDNERMTAINGNQVHKQMMDEACENFDSDITQIHQLHELILREIVGKATKKAYKELYNNTYLHDMEQKERSFEQEVNHIKLNMGTVINSNYWRMESMKNIFTIFQEELTEKFEKDFSEYQIKEPEEEELEEPNEQEEMIELEENEPDNDFAEDFDDEEEELEDDGFGDYDEYDEDEYEDDEEDENEYSLEDFDDEDDEEEEYDDYDDYDEYDEYEDDEEDEYEEIDDNEEYEEEEEQEELKDEEDEYLNEEIEEIDEDKPKRKKEKKSNAKNKNKSKEEKMPKEQEMPAENSKEKKRGLFRNIFK